MNIVFITPSFYPNIGGVEKHIKKLSDELIKDGHKIIIFTPKKDKNINDYEKSENIEIIRLNRLNKGLINRIYIIFQLYKNIKIFKNADIIHFHDYISFWAWGIYLYPVFKLFRKKIYITFHGWEGDFPPNKNIILKRKLCEILTTKNICIGNYIEKWYNTNADIISYGGTDIDFTSEISDNFIVFVGRLSNDTGILEYIKAWKVLSTRDLNTKFLIFGDGDLKSELENYINNKSIKNIEIKGFVINPKTYIAKAKVVFTSGYLSILEAFSHKKPVITFYDNDLKKDYLLLMPCSKENMWIASSFHEIIDFFEEALENKTKTENAYNFALKNTWNKLKQDYYKLWDIHSIENQLDNNNIQ